MHFLNPFKIHQNLCNCVINQFIFFYFSPCQLISCKRWWMFPTTITRRNYAPSSRKMGNASMAKNAATHMEKKSLENRMTTYQLNSLKQDRMEWTATRSNQNLANSKIKTKIIKVIMRNRPSLELLWIETTEKAATWCFRRIVFSRKDSKTELMTSFKNF